MINSFDKLISICEDISKDTENDAKEFDGKIFNGRTVGEYFGNQGAAIKALSKIIKEILNELKEVK